MGPKRASTRQNERLPIEIENLRDEAIVLLLPADRDRLVLSGDVPGCVLTLPCALGVADEHGRSEREADGGGGLAEAATDLRGKDHRPAGDSQRQRELLNLAGVQGGVEGTRLGSPADQAALSRGE
jgi:hypothetical protein